MAVLLLLGLAVFPWGAAATPILDDGGAGVTGLTGPAPGVATEPAGSSPVARPVEPDRLGPEAWAGTPPPIRLPELLERQARAAPAPAEALSSPSAAPVRGPGSAWPEQPAARALGIPSTSAPQSGLQSGLQSGPESGPGRSERFLGSLVNSYAYPTGAGPRRGPGADADRAPGAAPGEAAAAGDMAGGDGPLVHLADVIPAWGELRALGEDTVDRALVAGLDAAITPYVAEDGTKAFRVLGLGEFRIEATEDRSTVLVSESRSHMAVRADRDRGADSGEGGGARSHAAVEVQPIGIKQFVLRTLDLVTGSVWFYVVLLTVTLTYIAQKI